MFLNQSFEIPFVQTLNIYLNIYPPLLLQPSPVNTDAPLSNPSASDQTD